MRNFNMSIEEFQKSRRNQINRIKRLAEKCGMTFTAASKISWANYHVDFKLTDKHGDFVIIGNHKLDDTEARLKAMVHGTTQR